MFSKDTFFFDMDYLSEIAERHHQQYITADPFPHAVIDNFLPEEVAEEVLANFPDKSSEEWIQFQNAREKKLANNEDALMPPFIRHLLGQFNSAAMCTFVEKLTGIEGIIPDPYFWGGGQHQIERGGYLKIHADFNMQKKLRLDRRVNLLVYFNKDWEEAYGGHFELWDKDMEHCVQKILPIFNRCAVFSTTSTSYHGHPEPLTCPEGRSRKSLALYYYTQGRPEEEQNDFHTTLFKQRPGEGFDESTDKLTMGKVVKKLVPPIFVDGYRMIRGKKDN